MASAKKPASTVSTKKASANKSPVIAVTAPAQSGGVEIGKAAPAFSLRNEKGVTRTLRDYAGEWLVVYFYPRDDTPGCTTEACEFTSIHADFARVNARVVGVSPDTPERHAKFADQYKLKVELLADPERTALTAYGAYGKKIFYGKEIVGVLRSTVLINPQGKVAHHWTKVKAAGHADAVKARLLELQGT